MQRCPCCNARLRELEKCSRCKADLSVLVSNEQAARFWLAKAIQYYLAEKIEQSIAATDVSLSIKKTELAIALREFIIHQQCLEILDLLAQKQSGLARQRLYQVRQFFPYSQQLQTIHSFSDYLLVQH